MPTPYEMADGLRRLQLMQLVQNENRNQAEPLKKQKNTLSPEDLWWLEYMNGAMRQWNGQGGRNMDFMPTPANDARNAGGGGYG